MEENLLITSLRSASYIIMKKLNKRLSVNFVTDFYKNLSCFVLVVIIMGAKLVFKNGKRRGKKCVLLNASQISYSRKNHLHYYRQS